MSIFIDRETRVIVQGITGRMAQFHTKDMLEYGTNALAALSLERVARQFMVCPFSTP